MPAIKFYTDEHIAHAVARGLRSQGIDAITAAEVGNLSIPDEVHLQYATSQKRVLVSKDEDFVILHHAQYPHAGIAIAQQFHTIGKIISGLVLIAGIYDSSEMENYLEFL